MMIHEAAAPAANASSRDILDVVRAGAGDPVERSVGGTLEGISAMIHLEGVASPLIQRAAGSGKCVNRCVNVNESGKQPPHVT